MRGLKDHLGRWRVSWWSPVLCTLLAGSSIWPAQAGEPGDAEDLAQMRQMDRRVVSAREALRRGDRARLAADREVLMASHHRLASWVDYWDHLARIRDLTHDEADAFFARWPDSYVEDRMRNDWLLELGRRRDGSRLVEHHARFRMDDDREVTCYVLWAKHLAKEDVRAQAPAAWMAQKDADDGCQLMAKTLRDDRVMADADVWWRARTMMEAGRIRAVRQAVSVVDVGWVPWVNQAWEQPQVLLSRGSDGADVLPSEIVTLALIRWAASDPAAAALALPLRWEAQLAPEARAWAWAAIGRQGALKLLPDALGWFQRGASIEGARPERWGDDTLAWWARTALRRPNGQPAWGDVQRAIAAMSPGAQQDPAWVYWKARALQGSLPKESAGGQEAQALLERLASQHHYYGKLAAEDLGRTPTHPQPPAPATTYETLRASQNLGLNRSLALFGLGLRSEAVKEWNYTLRGMGDRDLIAAAQRACERQIWDRCINTSERTQQQHDFSQRFPTPYRERVQRLSGEVGVDAAYVYGLIRQESRFVSDARSHVGASGLMQVMPATARWTARKLGLSYTPRDLSDPDANLRLGIGYLKIILDDFDGMQALAAAGYNAGPNRPRRWREGFPVDAAVWVENIPFNETRDYVKKVLSNAADYEAILAGHSRAGVRTRLQQTVMPKAMPDTSAPEEQEVQ